MPMLSYHQGSPRFPGRSGRGLRDVDFAMVSSAAQVMDALRRSVCEKKTSGKAMAATEIIALGYQMVSTAKTNGMDFVTAGALTAQIGIMAYALARGEVQCAPPPSGGPTTPPVTPPATPPAAAGGMGAGTALAIGAGLVGAALIARK